MKERQQSASCCKHDKHGSHQQKLALSLVSRDDVLSLSLAVDERIMMMIALVLLQAHRLKPGLTSSLRSRTNASGREGRHLQKQTAGNGKCFRPGSEVPAFSYPAESQSFVDKFRSQLRRKQISATAPSAQAEAGLLRHGVV